MSLPQSIIVSFLTLAVYAVAEDGFVPIFNGTDLSGWEILQGTADYCVEDGCIVGTTAAGSPNSFLCTKKHYFDFELRFEVKLDNDELNSGCQIRSNTSPDFRNGLVHGYQVEIEPNGTAGFIYDEGRDGAWLSRNREDPARILNKAYRKGEWNSYRILCSGDSIKTWVNGIPVADVHDDRTRSGFIGLQVHSVPGDPKWQVRWRNLEIREIPIKTTALPGPKGLEGFTTEGNWIRQEDGGVKLVPRPGESGWARWKSYLWMEKQWDSFLCSYDFKYEKGGNSGFYFHVGDPDNPVDTGIEVQINDVFGWPEPLSHHELGGILVTRGPTRNMAKPPGEWQKMVVSCQGTHLKVWVNDVLVQNMFLDQTAMSGRPAKGWMGFQDHGLPFKLRNIRIAPLTGGPPIQSPIPVAGGVAVSGEWAGRPDLVAKHLTDGSFATGWGAPEGSRSGWIEMDLGSLEEVSRIVLDDGPYARTSRFEVKVADGDGWRTIAAGDAIGGRKQINFDKMRAQRFRIEILEATDVPVISEIQFFR